MWLSLASMVVAAAALAVAAAARRRMARLEERLGERARKGPYPPERPTYDSVELSFEAMLEELETRSREILQRIEERARALPQASAPPPEGPPAPRPAPQENGAPRPGPVSAAPPTRTGLPEKAAAVRMLAEQGLDVLEIAQRLGLGKGEVELILELRRHTPGSS